MTTYERIKSQVGDYYSTLIPAEEITLIVESAERKMEREFAANETSYITNLIEGRKKYLDKKAGKAAPKFEAAMYGNPKKKKKYADNDED